MKIVKIKAGNFKDYPEAILEVVEIIKSGGVVVYPTDTVYGLGANAGNGQAIEKIFRIKKRPETNPLILIAAGIEMAEKFAQIDAETEKILSVIWPNPVTVILKNKGNLPAAVTAGQATVALRVPDFELARYLSEKSGMPLISTSANISGMPPAVKSAQVIDYFEKQEYRPDLFLDAGDLSERIPSTILDLSGGEPKILRKGPVGEKEIFEIINKTKNAR
ncbi:MAG: L-threonylcarbamoyladenylate synthase [Candidatus Pacebacteria bacterium]|nr:L-threonylcarbamoyladenylate synthase [Candidatus Paceibacterota bacterium]